MTSAVFTSVALVATSAIVIGSLAYFWALRRSVAPFLFSVIVLWGGFSWAVGYYSSITYETSAHVPAWRHIAATFLGIAPLVLLPTVFTIAAVMNRAGLRRILLLATAGAVVALPVTFVTGLAASCYVAYACP